MCIRDRTGAKKSERKDLAFLIATRSNFPKKTSVKHNKIKKKLKFFPPLKILNLDGFPETIFSHLLLIIKFKSNAY